MDHVLLNTESSQMNQLLITTLIKLTTEIPTKDIVTLYNPGLSDEYMRGLLDNNMLTTEFLKASGGFQGTIVKFVDEIVY